MDKILENKKLLTYSLISFPLIYIIKLILDKISSNKTLAKKIDSLEKEKSKKEQDIINKSKILEEKENLICVRGYYYLMI